MMPRARSGPSRCLTYMDANHNALDSMATSSSQNSLRAFFNFGTSVLTFNPLSHGIPLRAAVCSINCRRLARPVHVGVFCVFVYSVAVQCLVALKYHISMQMLHFAFPHLGLVLLTQAPSNLSLTLLCLSTL